MTRTEQILKSPIRERLKSRIHAQQNNQKRMNIHQTRRNITVCFGVYSKMYSDSKQISYTLVFITWVVQGQTLEGSPQSSLVTKTLCTGLRREREIKHKVKLCL